MALPVDFTPVPMNLAVPLSAKVAALSRPSPQDLSRLLQEAVGLHQQVRLADAEKTYNRVLKILPNQFDALHLLGVLKLQSGKAGEAQRLITAALKVDARSPDAWANLGMVQAALKNLTEALASFDQALARAPGHIEALNNRGNLLLDLKRAPEALTCFEQILARQPNHLPARVNRANAWLELGRHEQAIAEYDAVLALHAAQPKVWFNRASALMRLGRAADALTSFERALSFAPDHVEAMNGRGLALQSLGRHEEALASYRKAIATNKDFADAHFNEALALLTLGDYRGGFPKFEWRWKRTGMPPRRSFGKPLWLGEYALQRKTILLHAEQGLGDTIQFARYAPLLARQGASVVLEVHPGLGDLLSRVEGVAKVVTLGEPLPPFDVYCPLASLPFALKTEPASVPADIPYLSALSERVETWRGRLGEASRPRIAIAWSGNASHVNDRNRSIALAALRPLLTTEGVEFVSIQRDLRDGEAEELKGLPVKHLGEELGDFDDTAAVLTLSDLAICVDTSVAHLSAAMGRPTWIFIPFWPDWRWTLGATQSPWYPQARLFRQSAPGAWESAIADVSAELERLAREPAR
jgi:tetratricopeptide (TPR) repeat protein